MIELNSKWIHRNSHNRAAVILPIRGSAKTNGETIYEIENIWKTEKTIREEYTEVTDIKSANTRNMRFAFFYLGFGVGMLAGLLTGLL